MKFSTSRAVMVSLLERDDLLKIHRKEDRLRRCLMNFEICDMLNIPSIKERYSIGEKDEEQAEYAKLIESRMRELNIEKQADGEGFVSQLDVDKTHAFDFAVLRNKENILWENPGKRYSLLDKLKHNL